MDHHDPAVKRTAIMQDAANGLTDLTEGKPFAYAVDGNHVWNARIMTSAGADMEGVWYEPGDILLHRCTWNPQHQSCAPTRSAVVRHIGDTDYVREVAEGIRKWSSNVTANMVHTIEQGQQATLPLPDGTTLKAGWRDASQQAEQIIREHANPTMVRNALFARILEDTPKPCTWWVEDYGYDNAGLYTVEWHPDFETGLIASRDFTHTDFDASLMGTVEVAATQRSQPLDQPFRPDDETMMRELGERDLADYQRQRDMASGAPDSIKHHIIMSGIAHTKADAEAPRIQADGHATPSWEELTDNATRRAAVGQLPAPRPPRRPEPMDPEARRPIPQQRTAQAPTMPTQPQESRPDHVVVEVPADLVRPYTRTGRDGREWHKMIVRMPVGTRIDGRDVSGYAFDRFMHPKQHEAKDAGKPVTIRLKAGEQVELFRGKGSQRRALTVTGEQVARAVADALTRPRDERTPQGSTTVPHAQEQPAGAYTGRPMSDAMREELAELDSLQPELKATAGTLVAQAAQYSWPRIDRLQERLAEYMADGTYRPELALKAAQRIIDHAALDHAQHHGKPNATQLSDSGFTQAQRHAAALLLMNELTESADKPAPSRRPAQTTSDAMDAPADEPLEPRRLAPTDTVPTTPEDAARQPPIPSDVPLPLPVPPSPKPTAPMQRDGQEQPRRSFKEMVSRFFTHDSAPARTRDIEPDTQDKPAWSSARHHR